MINKMIFSINNIFNYNNKLKILINLINRCYRSNDHILGLIITVFVVKYPSIPSAPKSLPIPESLIPPNGVQPY
jgi:hypothetical protein